MWFPGIEMSLIDILHGGHVLWTWVQRVVQVIIKEMSANSPMQCMHVCFFCRLLININVAPFLPFCPCQVLPHHSPLAMLCAFTHVHTLLEGHCIL